MAQMNRIHTIDMSNTDVDCLGDFNVINVRGGISLHCSSFVKASTTEHMRQTQGCQLELISVNLRSDVLAPKRGCRVSN